MIILRLIKNILLFLKGRKLGLREQVVDVLKILKWFCIFRWNTRPGDSALHESRRDDHVLIWTKRHDDAWATIAEEISPELYLSK